MLPAPPPERLTSSITRLPRRARGANGLPLWRGAKKVFISVPNRYFPVEHHTAIPLLHFWKRGFELACKCLGKEAWADERNLILMSWQRLSLLAPEGAVPVIGHTGIMMGRFSSNLFLF